MASDDWDAPFAQNDLRAVRKGLTTMAAKDGSFSFNFEYVYTKTEGYSCTWFDNQAKEAADYYCFIFKKSNIFSANPMAVLFELNGKKFMGLNGDLMFKFNEAVSLMDCETQLEIDHYWYPPL